MRRDKKVIALLLTGCMLTQTAVPSFASESNGWGGISPAFTDEFEDVQEIVEESDPEEETATVFTPQPEQSTDPSDLPEEDLLDISGLIEEIQEDSFLNAESLLSGPCGKNTRWSLNEGVLTISGTGETYDFSSNWNPSTAEAAPWESLKNEITQLVIEEGVTGFHFPAKIYTPNITNAIIADGCAFGQSFYGAEKLQTIRLPETMTQITANAFAGCSALETINVPAAVTEIVYQAFNNCTSLQSVTFAANSKLTSIDQRVFADCSALNSITLPNTLTSIGENAFYGCNANIAISYEGTLRQWDAVEKGTGNAVLSTQVVVQNAINTGECGEDAKWELDQNGTLYIYGTGSVTSAPTSVFQTMKKLVVESGITELKEGVQFSIRGAQPVSGLQEVQLADSVTSMGTMVFANCIALEKVTLPAQLTRIPDSAFANCTALSSIDVPVSVIQIGSMAFSGCTNLATVKLPTGLGTVEAGAFKNCSALRSVIYQGNREALSVDVWNGFLLYACGMNRSGKKGELSWSVEGKKLYLSGTVEIPSFSSYQLTSGLDNIQNKAWAIYSDVIEEIEIAEDITTVNRSAFDVAVNGVESRIHQIRFEGANTDLTENAFCGVTANVYYPATNTVWTDEVKEKAGGTITYCPYSVQQSNYWIKDISSDPSVTYGETLNVSAQAEHGDVYFEYSQDQENWSTAAPDAVGDWFVRAKVQETAEYQGLESAASPFSILYKITQDEEMLQLHIGKTDQLKLTVKPEQSSDLQIDWSSTDPNVVSVDETGKITAHAAGSATVIAENRLFYGTATWLIVVTDHQSDSGQITRQPTQNEEGLREYKCEICDTVLEQEIIPCLPEGTMIDLKEGDNEVEIPEDGNTLYSLRFAKDTQEKYLRYRITAPNATIYYTYSNGNSDFGKGSFHAIDYPGATGIITLGPTDWENRKIQIRVERLPKITQIEMVDPVDLVQKEGYEEPSYAAIWLRMHCEDGTTEEWNMRAFSAGYGISTVNGLYRDETLTQEIADSEYTGIAYQKILLADWEEWGFTAKFRLVPYDASAYEELELEKQYSIENTKLEHKYQQYQITVAETGVYQFVSHYADISVNSGEGWGGYSPNEGIGTFYTILEAGKEYVVTVQTREDDADAYRPESDFFCSRAVILDKVEFIIPDDTTLTWSNWENLVKKRFTYTKDGESKTVEASISERYPIQDWYCFEMDFANYQEDVEAHTINIELIQPHSHDSEGRSAGMEGYSPISGSVQFTVADDVQNPDEGNGEDPETPENMLEISEANFPDSIFRDYVKTNIDTNQDNLLSLEERSKVDIIRIEKKGVGSLEGIAYFPELTQLLCSGNQLEELDVSENVKLYGIDVSDNELKELDLSKNPEVQVFMCNNNQLTTIDLSVCPKLKKLMCNDNLLTEIDISKNPCLERFLCDRNDLVALDLHNHPDLTLLACVQNSIAQLDVSENTKLQELYCYENELEELDLSNNDDLRILSCMTNKLTELDLHNKEKLEEVAVSKNKLVSLNVKGCSALTSLSCNINSLSELDVSQSPLLEYLVLQSNCIRKLQLWNCPNLLKVISATTPVEVGGIAYNYELTDSESGKEYRLFVDKAVEILRTKPDGVEITQAQFPDASFREYVSSWFDLDKNGYLSEAEIANARQIVVPDKDIEDLSGIEVFAYLEVLACFDNKLKTIDVRKNLSLKQLLCSGNALTGLDVTNNTNLEDLCVQENKIVNLDLTKNPKLVRLVCWQNPLSGLDLSQNTKLQVLSCQECGLSSLDLSSNIELKELQISVNQFETIDLSHNAALRSFSCNVNQLQELDIRNNPELRQLISQSNKISVLQLGYCPYLQEAYQGEKTVVDGYYQYNAEKSENDEQDSVKYALWIDSTVVVESEATVPLAEAADLSKLEERMSQLPSEDVLTACNESGIPYYSEETIEAVRTARKKLEVAQTEQGRISKYDEDSLAALERAVNTASELVSGEDEAAILEAQKRISQLPSQITAGDEAALKGAREAFEALSERRKQQMEDKGISAGLLDKILQDAESDLAKVKEENKAPQNAGSQTQQTPAAEQKTTVLQTPKENITIPKTPAGLKAKAANKGKATVTWKQFKQNKKTKALWKKIKKIEVQYSTDPNFKLGVTSKLIGKKKTKLAVKKLLKNTTYYVRIRYTDGAGGYSNWSKVKKVRTKKK